MIAAQQSRISSPLALCNSNELTGRCAAEVMRGVLLYAGGVDTVLMAMRRRIVNGGGATSASDDRPGDEPEPFANGGVTLGTAWIFRD